jgi:hypothetical protein
MNSVGGLISRTTRSFHLLVQAYQLLSLVDVDDPYTDLDVFTILTSLALT